MSLFANDRYRWRETYFVLFDEADCPAPQALVEALRELGAGYQVKEVRTGKAGELESLTVVSPNDLSAMDISYGSGEEVVEQIAEWRTELQRGARTPREKTRLQRLAACNARFEVYHFEEVAAVAAEDDEEEFMDPGSLLLVLKCLAKLCQGLVYDPQSGTLM